VGRFPESELEQRHRQRGRDHRHPEHPAEVVRPEQHQQGGEEGAEERAHRVERLAQAEGRPPHLRRREVRHQGVAGRAADALADPVQQAGREHHGRAGGHREERLGAGCERVAGHRQPLAPAQPIAQYAREDLHDERGGLGQPLDDPHRERAGAERRHQEERQERVDHLRGDVHQEADAAQHPDAAGDAGRRALGDAAEIRVHGRSEAGQPYLGTRAPVGP
jgi:hypothetical protein